MAEETRVFTLQEVAKHASDKDCYIAVNGKVYDVTKFLDDHPGSRRSLFRVRFTCHRGVRRWSGDRDGVCRYVPGRVIFVLQNSTHQHVCVVCGRNGGLPRCSHSHTVLAQERMPHQSK